MLTTTDLYERPGYGIDVGDRVRFELLRGLELRTIDDGMFPLREVVKSLNPNSNRTVTGVIIEYRPFGHDNLEIDVRTDNGYPVILRLDQCQDLKVLQYCIE